MGKDKKKEIWVNTNSKLYTTYTKIWIEWSHKIGQILASFKNEYGF